MNTSLEETSFARGREFEPGWRHKKRPDTEVSSMLDKSFCAKPNKRVCPTTERVFTVDPKGSGDYPLPETFRGMDFSQKASN